MTNAINLASLLRTETKNLHTAAERAGIMPDMLLGRIDRVTYCRLLRNFHAIYEALETGLQRHAATPYLRRLHLPALARTAALVADLDFLHGVQWKVELPLTKSATRYVDRLNELCMHDPALLIAHAYVRYLGDLSGGQILRRIVGDALQLTGDSGISFYAFGAPGAAELARGYRDALGQIEVDAAKALRVLAEAQSAFRRHVEMFEELSGKIYDLSPPV